MRSAIVRFRRHQLQPALRTRVTWQTDRRTSKGIALIGPGFDDWHEARAILRATRSTLRGRPNLPVPAALPPSERRAHRARSSSRSATGLASDRRCRLDPASLATVFSSSAGDGYNCHELMPAAVAPTTARSRRRASTTRCHNAPSGYWSIASGAMAHRRCSCASDASFGAGLLERWRRWPSSAFRACLLPYDTDYPEPLRATRPVPDAMRCRAGAGAGNVRPHAGDARRAMLGDSAEALGDPALETAAPSIPAARACRCCARWRCCQVEPAGASSSTILTIRGLDVESRRDPRPLRGSPRAYRTGQHVPARSRRRRRRPSASSARRRVIAPRRIRCARMDGCRQSTRSNTRRRRWRAPGVRVGVDDASAPPRNAGQRPRRHAAMSRGSTISPAICGSRLRACRASATWCLCVQRCARRARARRRTGDRDTRRRPTGSGP
jgi:hypothetical protein